MIAPTNMSTRGPLRVSRQGPTMGESNPVRPVRMVSARKSADRDQPSSSSMENAKTPMPHMPRPALNAELTRAIPTRRQP